MNAAYAADVRSMVAHVTLAVVGHRDGGVVAYSQKLACVD